MSMISGWLVVMALAMACRSIVLPVRGAATISARCPLPSGAMRSSTRVDRTSGSVSSRMWSCGYSGVRLSKKIFSFDLSGGSKLTASTLMRAK